MNAEQQKALEAADVWFASLAYERARVGWRPASEAPKARSAKSTIVLVHLTVEFPDDPFKPGHPSRDVIFSAWWNLKEKQWYLNGRTSEDLKVIAWMPHIGPFNG